MIIPLLGGAYANVAHISLLSVVLPVQNRPNAFQVKLVLMGNHEHTAVGEEEEIRQLHVRVRNAIDALSP